MQYILILASLVWLSICASAQLACRRSASRVAVRNRTKSLVKPISWLSALFMAFTALSSPAHGQAASPDPQRQSLGSLNTSGEVFVNEAKAPSEVTIFSGDVVRTGDNGTAILASTANNSFEIARQSQVAFAGDSRYFAEIKSGAVSVKSMGGGAGAVLRVGNFVVVPTNRDERTAVTATSAADGSFLLTCVAGNTGVVPLQQGQGVFLQAGQSARISPQGELAAVETPTGGPAKTAGKNNKLWLYLGLAGAGVAGGVGAAIASQGHAPISPSAP